MKDKIVLVTGASEGLGTAVTQAFLNAGAKVAGSAREIQQAAFASANFIAIPADISTAAGAKALIDQVVQEFGRLDVLAYTVAASYGDGRRHISTNVCVEPECHFLSAAVCDSGDEEIRPGANHCDRKPRGRRTGCWRWRV